MEDKTIEALSTEDIALYRSIAEGWIVPSGCINTTLYGRPVYAGCDGPSERLNNKKCLKQEKELNRALRQYNAAVSRLAKIKEKIEDLGVEQVKIEEKLPELLSRINEVDPFVMKGGNYEAIPK